PARGEMLADAPAPPFGFAPQLQVVRTIGLVPVTVAVGWRPDQSLRAEASWSVSVAVSITKLARRHVLSPLSQATYRSPPQPSAARSATAWDSGRLVSRN